MTLENIWENSDWVFGPDLGPEASDESNLGAADIKKIVREELVALMYEYQYNLTGMSELTEDLIFSVTEIPKLLDELRELVSDFNVKNIESFVNRYWEGKLNSTEQDYIVLEPAIAAKANHINSLIQKIFAPLGALRGVERTLLAKCALEVILKWWNQDEESFDEDVQQYAVQVDADALMHQYNEEMVYGLLPKKNDEPRLHDLFAALAERDKVEARRLVEVFIPKRDDEHYAAVLHELSPTDERIRVLLEKDRELVRHFFSLEAAYVEIQNTIVLLKEYLMVEENVVEKESVAYEGVNKETQVQSIVDKIGFFPMALKTILTELMIKLPKLPDDFHRSELTENLLDAQSASDQMLFVLDAFANLTDEEIDNFSTESGAFMNPDQLLVQDADQLNEEREKHQLEIVSELIVVGNVEELLSRAQTIVDSFDKIKAKLSDLML